MHSPNQTKPSIGGIHLLTIQEVMARLKCSRSTCYTLLKEGPLKALHVRGATRVRSDHLDAYIESLSGDRGAS